MLVAEQVALQKLAFAAESLDAEQMEAACFVADTLKQSSVADAYLSRPVRQSPTEVAPLEKGLELRARRLSRPNTGQEIAEARVAGALVDVLLRVDLLHGRVLCDTLQLAASAERLDLSEVASQYNQEHPPTGPRERPHACPNRC